MTRPGFVLALDLAGRTGFARGWPSRREGKTVYVGSLVDYGALDFKLHEGEHPGLRLRRVSNALTELCRYEGHQPSLIAWEGVVAGGAGRRTGATDLYVLESRVVEIAGVLGIETATVWPSTLKKAAAGHGRADKAAMVRAARKRWGLDAIELPRDHEDEADALCLLGVVLDDPRYGCVPPTPAAS